MPTKILMEKWVPGLLPGAFMKVSRSRRRCKPVPFSCPELHHNSPLYHCQNIRAADNSSSLLSPLKVLYFTFTENLHVCISLKLIFLSHSFVPSLTPICWLQWPFHLSLFHLFPSHSCSQIRGNSPLFFLCTVSFLFAISRTFSIKFLYFASLIFPLLNTFVVYFLLLKVPFNLSHPPFWPLPPIAGTFSLSIGFFTSFHQCVPEPLQSDFCPRDFPEKALPEVTNDLSVLKLICLFQCSLSLSPLQVDTVDISLFSFTLREAIFSWCLSLGTWSWCTVSHSLPRPWM